MLMSPNSLMQSSLGQLLSLSAFLIASLNSSQIPDSCKFGLVWVVHMGCILQSC